VAAQLAGDAIGLDVEDDDYAVVLGGLVSRACVEGRGGWQEQTYTARGEQVAAVAEANRGGVPTACML
jgi:hypothetical protein